MIISLIITTISNTHPSSSPLHMAAFSLSHSSLHTTNHSTPFHLKGKPTSSSKSLISCRSQLPTDQEKSENKGEKDKKKRWWGLMELKEILSPKHNKGKGDWKDLVLMSFSFAVYVYISQRIVCAYCAWISILKHSL